MTVRRGNATVVDGVRYRSAFEATVATSLADDAAHFEYESERLTYSVPKVYVPDFTLWRAGDGHKIYVEAKGYFPSTDRTKMLAVRESNPDLDIRFVFQRADTPIRKGSRTTYAIWATTHDFHWADGFVPREWWRSKR